MIQDLSDAQNCRDDSEAWIYETLKHRLIAPNGDMTAANVKSMLALQPDLVVFHAVYIPSFIGIASILKREGIPYAVEPHGSLNRRALAKSPWKKRIAHILWVDRWIKKAKGVVYLCEEERDISRMPGLDYAIVPNTIPSDFRIYSNQHPVNKPIQLLSLGRIDHFNKGFDRLLAILQAMPEEIKSKIEVLIYGKGLQKEFDRLEAQIAEIHAPKIRFFGPVYGEEKCSVFRNADLFVMLSRYEGLPLTPYEAAASGLPVVVTEGTNRRTWVEANNNGWVLYDGQEELWPQQLAAAIEAYQKAPVLYRKNALRAANDLPTWEEIAKISHDAYRDWIQMSE